MSNLSFSGRARLRIAAEQAKRALSQAVHTTIDVESLYDGDDYAGQINRGRFELDGFTPSSTASVWARKDKAISAISVISASTADLIPTLIRQSRPSHAGAVNTKRSSTFSILS